MVTFFRTRVRTLNARSRFLEGAIDRRVIKAWNRLNPDSLGENFISDPSFPNYETIDPVFSPRWCVVRISVCPLRINSNAACIKFNSLTWGIKRGEST